MQYNGIIGSLQPKKEFYNPIAIGDIRTVTDEEWAAHWRPHGSGWANPDPNNVCYLERAYGGSDMSVIMGVSHFKTRLQLFNQKAGIEPAFTRNGNADAKELGHLYETPTAIKYGNMRRRAGDKPIIYIEGKTILPDGSYVKNPDGSIKDNPISMQMYRDGRRNPDGTFKYPWALANCDGLLVDTINGEQVQGILEIKTTSPMNYDVIDGWKVGIVPEGYFWQCVYYMAILNVMFCDICCSWDQTYNGTAVVRIFRDYAVEQKLFNAVAEFDEYVEQGIEPDLTDENAQLLNDYYYELFGPATTKDPMIELPEKYRNVVLRAIAADQHIEEIKKQLEDAEMEKQKIYSELYPVMGNNGYAQFVLNDKEIVGITLKTPMKMAKFDEERFKRENPALYEQCRVFSATELGKMDKKMKAAYTLPAEPDLEDTSKHPSFKLKIKEVKK